MLGMQLGFYFDQTRCIGCFTCCVACKDWNDIPTGPAHWRRVSCLEEGEYPNLFVAYLSSTCYHCAEPVCLSVCPAKAISKREEDGIVMVDRSRCREAAPCGIISDYGVPASATEGIWQAPCEVACPAHVAVPGYIALLAGGRYDEAMSLIRRNLPLPSVCGRICHHPCELECRRQELDEPIAISDLKRFVTDRTGALPSPLSRTEAEKVAIVGSGPAGLACAYDLLRKGYGVTVFEALPVAGGMPSVGIPGYRLPKDILNGDIEYLKALGIEIKTNSPLGTSFTLDDLEEGYGATFIAIGAQKGTIPHVTGADLDGVMIGLNFLREINLGKKVEVEERVLVLGGGNVAFDCARVAKRLGAKEVHLVCPERREDMPAFPIEIKEGLEEGVMLHPSLTLLRVLGSNGRVSGAECGRVERMEFDDEGRLHVNIIGNSEHTIFVDNVIFATGQAPDIDSLRAMEGVELTKRGTIAIDPETMETSRPGIFAGGDAVTGPTTVIEAIASGQRAATYMQRYLKGEVLKDSLPRQKIRASDIKVSIPAEVKRQKRQEMPVLSPSRRVEGLDEIALGFSENVALVEAGRCLNCAGFLCRVVCPYGAPQFDVGANPKMQMCTFCLDRWSEGRKPLCVDSCPMRALDAGPLEELKAKYGENQEAAQFIYSPQIKPSIIFKAMRRL